jgi:hypothetical protein
VPLDRSVDLELYGRGRHTLYRRLGLGILALIVAAALFGVFGQQTSTTEARGADATLSVNAPAALRGGLLFQARFQIHAERAIAHPRLVLDSGWLNSITLNTVAPTPESQSSSAEGLSMNFATIPAGETLTVWTDWQVNPTNVGRHAEDVSLYDGPKRLATVHRTVTVFP